MRGIEFMTLMYGAKTSASSWMRPSAIPQTTPSTTPMTKPSTASSSVTKTCSHSEPACVPCWTQFDSWETMRLGSPKKNGSTTPVRAHSSQPPTRTTKIATRSAITPVRRRGRARGARGAAASLRGSGVAGSAAGTEMSVDDMRSPLMQRRRPPFARTHAAPRRAACSRSPRRARRTAGRSGSRAPGADAEDRSRRRPSPSPAPQS